MHRTIILGIVTAIDNWSGKYDNSISEWYDNAEKYQSFDSYMAPILPV